MLKQAAQNLPPVHPSIEALLMLVRGLLSPNPLGPYSQRDKKLHAGQLALEMVS